MKNNHMQNDKPFSCMRMHCDWLKMYVAMRLQMTLIHIAIKVSLTRAGNETRNHRLSHRYWDGIEEMKVKHFVNHSGLK